MSVWTIIVLYTIITPFPYFFLSYCSLPFLYGFVRYSCLIYLDSMRMTDIWVFGMDRQYIKMLYMCIYFLYCNAIISLWDSASDCVLRESAFNYKLINFHRNYINHIIRYIWSICWCNGFIIQSHTVISSGFQHGILSYTVYLEFHYKMYTFSHFVACYYSLNINHNNSRYSFCEMDVLRNLFYNWSSTWR